MKRLCSTLILLIYFTLTFSQPDPQYTHSMYNLMAINPAFAGSQDEVYMSILTRKDFFNLKGISPWVLDFNVNAPFKLFGKSHGVGLSLQQDRLGFKNNLIGDLSYAYKFETSAGKFGLGLNLGVYFNAFQNPGWNPPDGPSSLNDDKLIPSEQYTKTALDLGFGLFYRNENLYAGISGLHLNSPKIVDSLKSAPSKISPEIYITAGYNIQLTNPLIVLKPSILVHNSLSMTKVDLIGLVEYNKKIWGGVSYKTGASFSAIFGIELLNGIRIGMAYDLGTNTLEKYALGSYEFLINYHFNLKVERKAQRYKSIRFL